jgi:xylulokinase
MFDDATPVARAVAVGGGLRSPVWAQALSDITGQTQLVTEQTIGASYGDGLLAAIGVGAVPPETDWATVASEIPPNPDNAALYDDLYENWLRLYPATREIVHTGARLTR